MSQELHEDNHENYQTIHVDGKLLGALPKKEDPRTLKLKNFLDTPQSPPRSYDFEMKDGIGPDLRYALPFEPFRGQQWGSCTISSQAEYIRRRVRGTNFGSDLYIDDTTVNRRYFKLAGDPTWDSDSGNPQFDTGLYELDALNDLVKNGFTFGEWQYTIAGYAEIDIKDLDHLRMAIATFGGIKVCIDVPMNLYHSNPDEVVPYVSGSQSVGGHSMYWNAYDESTFTMVHTWNRKRQRVTTELASHIITEGYSLIDSKDIRVASVIDLGAFKEAVREVINTPI